MFHAFPTRLALTLVTAIGLLTAAPAGKATPQEPQQPPPSQSGQGQPQQGQPQQGQAEGAPAGQAQPQQPTFRAGVNFVRVDVIVTGRDGEPVESLTPADFEVTEDGKPQQIETFRFVSVSGFTRPGEEAPRAIRTDFDEEAEASKDDVRLFAIFLDDYHVRRGASMSVRKPLIQFLQTQVGDRDMVGIMYPLTPISAVRMTRNRQELISAIEAFEGRKYDYRPRNEMEDKYAMYPAAVVERIRNQVSMSALQALVLRMGGLREGRKAVILVSEGYTNILPPQLRDPIAAFPGLGNPNRGNSGATSDERADFFANIDIFQELREVFDAANRSNTTIYALDPRGLTPFEFDINEGVNFKDDQRYLDATMDTLRTLAEETDGRAIVNRNDLERGLRQVVRDSSAYYLIGYNSSQPKADGKFHEIKVKVKRPGIQVRARKGYWALTEEEMELSAVNRAKPSAPSEVTKALGEIASDRRSRLVRTWVGTSRGENGMTRVTFSWEAAPAVPGTGQDRPQAAAVQLLAAGPGGTRPYFRGRVASPAGDGADGGSARGGQVSFDAEPGEMQLRLSVEDPASQVIDTDLREVKVPDLTRPEVSLSTPAVFRAANAREFRTLAADPAALPAASREFRRTERLLVRFEAYLPGEKPPEVTARVLNRSGQGMSDIPVKAPESPGTPYQLDIPLAGFPAGDYLIEVKARGADGEATELVPMRVAG